MEYELIDFFNEEPCMVGTESQAREMYKEMLAEGCLVAIKQGNNIVDSPIGKSFDVNKEA